MDNNNYFLLLISIITSQNIFNIDNGTYQASYLESHKDWIHLLVALLMVYKEVCPRMSKVHFLSVVALLVPKVHKMFP